MGEIQFYWRCLRHAPLKTWVLLGAISTVATFVMAVAAKLGAADLDMNAVVLIAGLLAIVAALVVIPVHESFKLYKEAQGKAEAAASKLASLNAQLDDRANRAAVGEALAALATEGRALRDQILGVPGDQLTEMEGEIQPWASRVYAFLAQQVSPTKAEYVAATPTLPIPGAMSSKHEWQLAYRRHLAGQMDAWLERLANVAKEY